MLRHGDREPHVMSLKVFALLSKTLVFYLLRWEDMWRSDGIQLRLNGRQHFFPTQRTNIASLLAHWPIGWFVFLTHAHHLIYSVFPFTHHLLHCHYTELNEAIFSLCSAQCLSNMPIQTIDLVKIYWNNGHLPKHSNPHVDKTHRT